MELHIAAPTIGIRARRSWSLRPWWCDGVEAGDGDDGGLHEWWRRVTRAGAHWRCDNASSYCGVMPLRGDGGVMLP
jgi:hypothetical protein